MAHEKSLTELDAAAQFAREQKNLKAKRRRRLGPPPERDLKIFKLVAIQHLTHDEVARRCGTTRARVTQIVGDVRRSLAQAAPDDPEINNLLARQKLDQALEKMNFELIIEKSVEALHREPRSLTNRRSGDRDCDGKKVTWDETTVREQPVNVQLLKTILRAVEGLRRLRESSLPSGETSPQKPTFEEFFETICYCLEWFHGAVYLQEDHDRPSPEFVRMVDTFRVNAFIWVLERKKGTPPALAWPGQRPIPQAFCANIANIPPADVNIPQPADRDAAFAPTAFNPETSAASLSGSSLASSTC